MTEKLHSLKLSDVQINDSFWNRYRELVRKNMLPYQWKVLNDQVPGAAPSHCIENFKIAAGISKGEYYGQVFQDSDVAKWLEAVSYSLETDPDVELEKEADQVIDILEKAQQPDGYLDTYYLIKEPGMRWSNLREGHELYVAGHMIEAGIAYYHATGKRKLLEIVMRMADCICNTFGEEPEKIQGCPGHPEIELALIKLYRLIGEKRYLDKALYFINLRGDQQPNRFDLEQKKNGFHHIFPEFSYLGYNNIQAHLPVRQQKKADGHAVRALYLYSGMADTGYEAGDETLLEACRELFDNITEKQMLITGSVGTAADGECFTCDYDLPNNYNYSETCASVALLMFAYRMFQIDRDGRYMDVAERALYNTVLAGMSLQGTEFFYVNPLEVIPEQLRTNRTLHHVLPERRKWMGVACCPPNIARTLSNLGSYVYSADKDTVFFNLYVSGNVKAHVAGEALNITVETQYPYDGKISVSVAGNGNCGFALAFREPGWTKIEKIFADGEEIKVVHKKGYLYTEKKIWTENTTFTFEISMEPVLLCAHPSVAFDTGKAAVMRGPIVYCAEETDNGTDLGSIILNANGKMSCEYQKDFLGGTVVITAESWRISKDGWEGRLYQPLKEKLEPCTIRMIPYSMWNNRGVGEMRVWMRVR